MRRRCALIGSFFCLLAVLLAAPLAAQDAWRAAVAAMTPNELAAEANKEGDPVRGATLFTQGTLACASCHEPRGDGGRLGPDLSQLPSPNDDAHLVQSLLEPSAVIRKGYEAATLVDAEGRTLTGVVVERDDERLMFRSSVDGELLTLSNDDVESLVVSDQSPMPQDLVEQLPDRQSLLDLLSYVIEIVRGGPVAAARLRPMAVAAPLPEYENRLDHAGLIRDWDDDALERGAKIYGRVCANCHGTLLREGSLPTSLRFAEGVFKNGADPHGMYRTLTHGYGRMQPQRWMVPQQKYDVIHYIRETYLRDRNPNQYVEVDGAYIASLPGRRRPRAGTGRFRAVET